MKRLCRAILRRMTLASRRSPASLVLLLGLGACEPKPAGGDPTPPPPSAEQANCYPAAEARDLGSYAKAEPPFADCAKHLKVHCGGKGGERGPLTGLALDPKATTAARKQQPDACCYDSCD